MTKDQIRQRNNAMVYTAAYDGLTLQQIGDRFGLTRERIRQILEAMDIDLSVLRQRRANLEKAYREALRSLRLQRTTTILGNGKPRPEYRVYANMLRRCFDPKDPGYKNYGARGITVRRRWLGKDGFQNFYKDMGPRPEGQFGNGRSQYSIHRIDNDAGYSPDNCKWATQREQCENRRERRPPASKQQ